MAPAARSLGATIDGVGPERTHLSLPADLIAYLSGLTLSGGDRDREPFTVLPWERRFVRGAFGQTGHAALSVGRGNGKSCVVAGLAAAVVDPSGPLTGNRRECVCVASSFEQSRVIFEDVLSFLRAQYDLADRKRVAAPGFRQPGDRRVPADRHEGPHDRLRSREGARAPACPRPDRWTDPSMTRPKRIGCYPRSGRDSARCRGRRDDRAWHAARV